MTTADGVAPRDGEVGYFVSLLGGDVLDVAKWGMYLNAGAIIAWHRKSTDVLNQRWSVRALADGAFQISPLSAPGKALDQLRAPARYQIPDVAVQWDQHGRRSQWWSFAPTGTGTFAIVNVDSDARVTYQGHAKQVLVVRRIDGDPAQQWRFEPVD